LTSPLLTLGIELWIFKVKHCKLLQNMKTWEF